MLAHFIKDIVVLFVIVAPNGAIPLFLTMTQANSLAQRERTALLAGLTTTCVLLTCALLGQRLFSFFNISVPAFRIAGGVLLFSFGYAMLQVVTPRMKSTHAEIQAGVEKEQVGIAPLGIPMLAGPGAITTVLVLRGQAGQEWEAALSLGAAIVVVGTLTWLILRWVAHLQERISPIVLGIIGRIEGLLLATIAVQMILDGVHGAFNLPPAP